MDWNKPTLANTFSEVLSGLRGRDDESATLFKDSAGTSNLPSGAVRFNRTTQVLETWDGSSWQPLPLSPAAISGLNAGSKLASQAQAQAASDADALMSPLRVKDQIDSRLASSAEAQAGLDQAKLMTPARTKEIFAANVASDVEVASGAAGAKFVTAGALKTHLDSRIGSAGGSVSFRNLLVNGEFIVNQFNTTSAGDCVDCIDGWYALAPSGSLSVVQQRMQEPGQTCNLRLTQPDDALKRFGLAQIVRNSSCAFTRSASVRLKARVRSSAAIKVNLAILSWSGAVDGVSRDVVNDWAALNYSAGSFFAASSLAVVGVGNVTLAANGWSDLSVSGTVPADMNNLIAVIWTEAAVAKNGTLDIGLCQLEQGSDASAFEHRPQIIETSLIGVERTFFYGTPGTYYWTCPVGVRYISLYMGGGGGGGAGGYTCMSQDTTDKKIYSYGWASAWGAVKAGRGGTYFNPFISVSPGMVYTLTIGSGGICSPNTTNNAPITPGGATGGSSSFGSLAAVSGGTGVTWTQNSGSWQATPAADGPVTNTQVTPIANQCLPGACGVPAGWQAGLFGAPPYQISEVLPTNGLPGFILFTCF